MVPLRGSEAISVVGISARLPRRAWSSNRSSALAVGILGLGFRFGGLPRNDAIDAIAVGLLGFERETELLAHHAGEKAAHRVLLPAGPFHDRGDGRPFGLAQQSNHGCLL